MDEALSRRAGARPHTPSTGRRIVLTGGAGFIGHHLALRLAERGARVDVVDHLQVNHLGDIASRDDLPNRMLYLAVLRRRLERLERGGVRLHRVDARDRDAVARVLDDGVTDAIVHLAGVAHADRSNLDPYRAFDHGLNTLAVALDLARGRVDRFVFLSSSMVYGNFDQPAITEEHPPRPVSVYGALKVSGEAMVRAHQAEFQLPYTIIRPSAVYGPGAISGSVTQSFIERAMQGYPLRIEGDGTETLDFTYVGDLTRGIVGALESPAAVNETFNMTYGKARSLLDLADTVRAAFPATEIVFTERDRFRPRRGTLLVDKARRLLGYAPRVPLEMGIPRCIRSLDELGFPHARQSGDSELRSIEGSPATGSAHVST